VTLQDIENTEKILGPDLGILRGRNTHGSPAAIWGEEDCIEIPLELKVHHQNIGGITQNHLDTSFSI
jgi:hypothetical protein